MEAKFLSKGKINQFLDSIKGEVFLPQKRRDHFTWSRWDGEDFSFEGFRPTLAPKFFFYSPKEVLKEKKREERAVVGMKACDLRGIAFLRKVFREGDFVDPFFRDDVLIISADCTYPDSTCFCTLLGDNPYPGSEEAYDLNLSETEDGYLVDIGSDRGRGLVEESVELFSEATPEQIQGRERMRGGVKKEIKGNSIGIEGRIEPEKALDEIRKCVSCGACTNICPGCFCFLLQERKDFEKVRFWDSCQLPGYARVAGGANPHKDLDQRFIHRVRCKFEYCPERYDSRGCFACGRCVTACIGGIDFEDVLQSL